MAGPCGRLKLSISRIAMKSKRGPEEGADVSGGVETPASNMSRTAYVMPPHMPFAASPIGRMSPPGRSIFQSGTCGQLFEKCRPRVDGRKPGTRTDVTPEPPFRALGGALDHDNRREPSHTLPGTKAQ